MQEFNWSNVVHRESTLDGRLPVTHIDYTASIDDGHWTVTVRDSFAHHSNNETPFKLVAMGYADRMPNPDDYKRICEYWIMTLASQLKTVDTIGIVSAST